MGDERAMYPTQPDAATPEAHTTDYGEGRSCRRVDPKTGESKVVPGCVPTPFHPGIDLVPPKVWWKEHASAEGFPVFAPFDGWILYSGPVPNPKDDDVSAWLAGYGPGVVILAHDDQADAGIYDPSADLPWSDVRAFRFSLLGHVKPLFDVPLDPDVRKLQRARFGKGAIDDTKWLHDRLTSSGSVRHLTDVMMFEPSGRDSALLQGGRYVRKGTLLGEMTKGAGHTHWEVRTTPFASPGPLDGGKVSPGNATALQLAQQQRIDPHAWLSHYVDVAARPPPEVNAPAPKRDDDGIGWLVLLGIAYAISEGDRR